jgi:hypothetical protein
MSDMLHESLHAPARGHDVASIAARSFEIFRIIASEVCMLRALFCLLVITHACHSRAVLCECFIKSLFRSFEIPFSLLVSFNSLLCFYGLNLL